MSDRRCPHCGALVSAEAEWCGQCLQRLTTPALQAPGRDTPPEPPAAPADEAPATERAEPAPDEVEPVPDEGEPAPDEGEPDPDEGEPPPGEAGPPPVEREPVRADAGEGRGPDGRARRDERRADGVFQRVGDRLIWTCPACEMENPLEATECPRCGTSFSNLFREPEVRRAVSASRAAALSLLFPGVGHAAAGQVAEGVARGILFAWALATTIGLLLVGGEGSGSVRVPFLMVYAMATAALYTVSALDAYRAAESLPPVAPIKLLFYAASGLMAVTVGFLLFTGLGAQS